MVDRYINALILLLTLFTSADSFALSQARTCSELMSPYGTIIAFPTKSPREQPWREKPTFDQRSATQRPPYDQKFTDAHLYTKYYLDDAVTEIVSVRLRENDLNRTSEIAEIFDTNLITTLRAVSKKLSQARTDLGKSTAQSAAALEVCDHLENRVINHRILHEAIDELKESSIPEEREASLEIERELERLKAIIASIRTGGKLNLASDSLDSSDVDETPRYSTKLERISNERIVRLNDFAVWLRTAQPEGFLETEFNGFMNELEMTRNSLEIFSLDATLVSKATVESLTSALDNADRALNVFKIKIGAQGFDLQIKPADPPIAKSIRDSIHSVQEYYQDRLAEIMIELDAAHAIKTPHGEFEIARTLSQRLIPVLRYTSEQFSKIRIRLADKTQNPVALRADQELLRELATHLSEELSTSIVFKESILRLQESTEPNEIQIGNDADRELTRIHTLIWSILNRGNLSIVP